MQLLPSERSANDNIVSLLPFPWFSLVLSTDSRAHVSLSTVNWFFPPLLLQIKRLNVRERLGKRTRNCVFCTFIIHSIFVSVVLLSFMGLPIYSVFFGRRLTGTILSNNNQLLLWAFALSLSTSDRRPERRKPTKGASLTRRKGQEKQ